MAVLLVAACPAVRSIEPGPSVSAFVHTVWTARDGAPDDVWGIAQTNDGWLWFGGRDGLSRFDGVRFGKVELPQPGSGPSRAVSALYALRSGGLAIGHLSGGVSLLQAGKITQFDGAELRRGGAVLDFYEDDEDILWASTANGLSRFDGRRWETIGADWGYSGGMAGAVVQDGKGTLWVSTSREILRLPAHARRFESSGIAIGSIAEFIQSADGRFWFTDENGTRLLDGAVSTGIAASGPARKSYTALFDREGRYWSLFPQPGHVPDRAIGDIAALGAAKALYQDRDGNMWSSEIKPVIHRLRSPSIVRARTSMPALEAGWPWTNLAVDSSDRLWLATSMTGHHSDPSDGVWTFSDTLLRVQQDEIASATAIFRDASGTVWIGGQGGIWKLHEGRFAKAIERPAMASNDYMSGLTVDCAGGTWATFRSAGLMRYDGSTWQHNGDVAGLPAEPPTAQNCESNGRLWLGYGDGTVASVERGKAVVFTLDAASRVGAVSAISAGQNILVGGERGLALLRDGRFRKVVARIPAFDDVTTIVERPDGDVWLNGARGVVHIAADALRGAATDDVEVVAELFDGNDGYPGPGFNLAGSRTTMAMTASGRIWLVAGDGLATIDPSHVGQAASASPVIIENVAAQGKSQALSQDMKLSAGTRSIEIDYTALNYAHPDRLRFRYRLDGIDDGWVDAATRRQAFYSNLGPGDYRFVVNVTDVNGAWTDSSAQVDFVIPPTFVQSRLFFAICAASLAALLFAVHRINVRRIDARQRRLLEERLGERERIARELHDTLLQGTQALIYNLYAAVKAIPDASPARPRLADALRNAEHAMTEGRDRIQDLRSNPSAHDDIEGSLAHEGAELARDRAIAFRVVVAGSARAIAPALVEPIYRIAREAMLNAFRHADARTINVHVDHLADRFRLRVIDDGVGIGEETAGGRSPRRHWGLPGMHERARSFGGELELRSRPGEGTAVILSVPATIAYEAKPKRSRWSLFG